MASGKFISYLRVSTDKQGRNGLGIEAQREAVASYLNGGRWTLASEYVETESGRRSDRPKLMSAKKDSNIDEPDRFSAASNGLVLGSSSLAG